MDEAPPSIEIVENVSPSITVPDGHIYAGEEAIFPLSPYDPEGDKVEIYAEGLPEGARFDEAFAEIRWSPRRTDVGEHRFLLVVSDGLHEDRYTARLFVDEEGWKSPFSLGISYVGLSYEGALYGGPAFDLALIRSGEPDADSGPSRGQLHASIGILHTPSGSALTRYSTGVDLSLEGRARRRVMLPMSGAEIAGLRASDRSPVVRVIPRFGLWLYDGPRLSVRASCGYGYALTDAVSASGVECSAALHASSW